MASISLAPASCPWLSECGAVAHEQRGAAQVRVTVEMPDGPDLVLRFGTQLDTQTVNSGPTGELTGSLLRTPARTGSAFAPCAPGL